MSGALSKTFGLFVWAFYLNGAAAQSCSGSSSSVFSVTSATPTGACVVTSSGTCISTASISRYTSGERCSICVRQSARLSVQMFQVESAGFGSCPDSLMVNGHQYCGSAGPVNVNVAAGSTMSWHTDDTVSGRGFFICGITSVSAPTAPTAGPTSSPTAAPSAQPTFAPTATPTAAPTAQPTATPTAAPTRTLTTAAPTEAPTAAPTRTPTTATRTEAPTRTPTTAAPTEAPTAAPTQTPTTATPSEAPTATPTGSPAAPAAGSIGGGSGGSGTIIIVIVMLVLLVIVGVALGFRQGLKMRESRSPALINATQVERALPMMQNPMNNGSRPNPQRQPEYAEPTENPHAHVAVGLDHENYVSTGRHLPTYAEPTLLDISQRNVAFGLDDENYVTPV